MIMLTTLTKEECEGIYEIIDILSGYNAGNAFVWDGTDDPNDPGTRAVAKIFKAIGREVPEELA